ncbi:iron-enterobactin ABC transporter permease [Serratia marcescens]|uniref:iron-enterobactin ABC transporter permease n=1 Tax=Serratia marcescens TaxID=615 RepID=UPI0038923C31
MSLPHKLHIGRPDGVINGRLPLRLLLVNLSLLALCLVMAVAALCYGTLQLSLEQVFAALTGEAPKNLVTVVTQWRLPRIAMALLLGAALGMSGAIFQSIIRNPLGSPDVIGFNMGAYTGALIAITLFNGGYYYIAGGALAGGILAALAIYLLAWRQGIAGFRLIIVGIAISAVLVSTNTWLIITASLERAMDAAMWQAGSLNGMTWQKAQPATAFIVLAAAAALLMGKRLQLLEMGDDTARALGVNAEGSRLWLMLFGVTLTAAVTATAGPISFIALAAPQIARRLAGQSSVTLTSSALMGAALLLGADVVSQHLFAPIQLPVGVVTVCIGGLYLIWLLIREARR